MSSKFVLVITTNNDAKSTTGEVAPIGNSPGQSNTTGAGAWDTMQDIAQFIIQETMGRGINCVYYDTALAATQTYTATGQPSNNDTASVNGQTFTAVTGTPTANQFKIGATTAATLVNFAAAINASTSTSIVGVVTATATSATVVTITALVPGATGNKLTTTSSLTNITAGGATLTSGSQANVATISAGI